MKRKLSALNARRRFGELLEEVYYRGDEVVIERAGKPMAVVIPPERYQALERNRERLFAMIDEVQARNANVPPEVIEAEVDEAVRAVRREARQRARAASE
jgi:prevent-host-death family protein